MRQVDEEVLYGGPSQDGARGRGAAHSPLQHLRQGIQDQDGSRQAGLGTYPDPWLLAGPGQDQLVSIV